MGLAPGYGWGGQAWGEGQHGEGSWRKLTIVKAVGSAEGVFLLPVGLEVEEDEGGVDDDGEGVGVVLKRGAEGGDGAEVVGGGGILHGEAEGGGAVCSEEDEGGEAEEEEVPGVPSEHDAAGVLGGQGSQAVRLLVCPTWWK